MGPAAERGGVQWLSHCFAEITHRLRSCGSMKGPDARTAPALAHLQSWRSCGGGGWISERQHTQANQAAALVSPLHPSLLCPIASALAAGRAGPGLAARARGCGTRKSAAAEAVSVRRVAGASGLRSWWGWPTVERRRAPGTRSGPGWSRARRSAPSRPNSVSSFQGIKWKLNGLPVWDASPTDQIVSDN